MEFTITEKTNPNVEKYQKQDLDFAYQFAKELHKEFGNFLKTVVIFGSTSRRSEKRTSDIDILIVLDDVSVSVTNEMSEAYKIIVQRLIRKVTPRLHAITMRLTSFWEYVRSADPVAVNILRDGVALIDSGFFDPIQLLMRKGRIRPTEESIWMYYVRAPNTLHNSKWHILQATVDLYWAVIDAAHAALMKVGEIPPTPEHVADLMEAKLVNPKHVEKKYVQTMRNFYKMAKMITYREIKEVKGQEYDKYYLEASDFVDRMRNFIEGVKKK
jgi:predicted nucleotidyltransferase/uncharacterized protein (UPF0332 family)